jgi:hypothetical protein
MSTQNDYIEKVEIEGHGRFYRSPTSGKWFPSVTTVVNHEDQEFWKKWREDPEKKKISEVAIARGTRMHEVVEKYLIEQAIPESIEDKQHFDLIFPYLQNIGEVYAIEKPLWSDVLRMAGRVDCIADYEGSPAIIDFKTARKPKKKSWIKNYFNQAAAYSWMWEERTGMVAENIVLMFATDTGESQLFIENRKDFKVSLGDAMKSYWTKNDFKDIQEIANGMAH